MMVARIAVEVARAVKTDEGRLFVLQSGRDDSVLELAEVTPPVEDFFGMIHGAARAWDGTDPVRRLGP